MAKAKISKRILRPLETRDFRKLRKTDSGPVGRIARKELGITPAMRNEFNRSAQKSISRKRKRAAVAGGVAGAGAAGAYKVVSSRRKKKKALKNKNTKRYSIRRTRRPDNKRRDSKGRFR